MSKRFMVMAAVATASVLITVFVTDAGDNRQAIMSALGEQPYVKCGMDKLNPQERRNLFSLIGAYPVVSYTESAAEAYVRKAGWKQVQVLGAVVIDTTWGEKQLVVSDQYDLYLLDPFIVPALPDPGVYWAQTSGTSWKIMMPDGDEGDYWAKELK
jgi:hypothetical protein